MAMDPGSKFFNRMGYDLYNELKKKDPATLNEWETKFVADPGSVDPGGGATNPNEDIVNAIGYSLVGDELKASAQKKGLSNASSKILGAQATMQGFAPKASRSLLGY